MSAPPLVHPFDLSAHAGQVVRLAGTYKADFSSAHKMLSRDGAGKAVTAECVVLLALDDGSFVDLFDRPQDEGQRFSGKSVVVTGELCAPLSADSLGNDDAAAEDALFELIRISLVELA